MTLPPACITNTEAAIRALHAGNLGLASSYLKMAQRAIDHAMRMDDLRRAFTQQPNPQAWPVLPCDCEASV